MQIKLVSPLLFFVNALQFGSLDVAQSISLPNLISKMNIPALFTPAPPKSLPSISFKVEPAPSIENHVGDSPRSIPEDLLSSIHSQLEEANKISSINEVENSELIPLPRRTRTSREERRTNTHVYLYSAPEETLIRNSEPIFTTHPAKEPNMLPTKDSDAYQLNIGPYSGTVLQNGRTIIYILNQPSAKRDSVWKITSGQNIPEIYYYNEIPPQAATYDHQHNQENNQPLFDVPLSENPMRAAPPVPNNMPQESTPNNMPQESMPTKNKLPNSAQYPFYRPEYYPYNPYFHPYLVPNRYNPYPVPNRYNPNLIDPSSQYSPNPSFPIQNPNGANLLSYALPAILQRISNAPQSADGGSEFKFKLKGLL